MAKIALAKSSAKENTFVEVRRPTTASALAQSPVQNSLKKDTWYDVGQPFAPSALAKSPVQTGTKKGA